MNLGITKHMKDSEFIGDVTEEAVMMANLEAIEAMLTLESATTQLDSMVEAEENLVDVVTTIEAYGIDDALIALIGEDIASVTGSFATKDATVSAEEIGVAVEGLGAKIVEVLSKIWETIKAFFAKIVRFFYKVEDSVMKNIQKLKGNKLAWKNSDFEWEALDEGAPIGKAMDKLINTVASASEAAAAQLDEFKTLKYTGKVKDLKVLVNFDWNEKEMTKLANTKTLFARKEKADAIFADIEPTVKTITEAMRDAVNINKSIGKVKLKKLNDTSTPKGIKASKALSACSRMMTKTNGILIRGLGQVNKILKNMQVVG